MAGVLLQGATVDIHRAQLNATLARQPEQIFRKLQAEGVIDTLASLQSKRELGGRLTPEEAAELSRAALQVGITTGNFAGLLRSDTAQDRIAATNAATLLKQAKELAATDPDRAKVLEQRAINMMMQSMGISTEVPSVPQSLMLPR